MATATAQSSFKAVDETDRILQPSGKGCTLTSFTDTVTEQDKGDVHDSLLLARLAADKKFDVKKDSKSWYAAFSDVLPKLGWIVQESQFKQSHEHSHQLTLSTAVVDDLPKSATRNELDAVKTMLQSLQRR